MAITYKLPSKKTPVNTIFCMKPVCKCHSKGMGIEMMAVSVKILGIALLMIAPSKLMQLPGRKLSQAFAIGEQRNMLTSTIETPQERESPPRMYAVMRTLRSGKMRVYIMRTAIFTVVSMVT